MIREISELSKAIQYGEVFSEARARDDYPNVSGIAAGWIGSHESLRKHAREWHSTANARQSQIDALNSQLEDRNKEISDLRRELYDTASERDRIRKRLEREVSADNKYGKTS